MKIVDRTRQWSDVPKVIAESALEAEIKLISDQEGVSIYKFTIGRILENQIVSVKWCVPCINVRGVWSSNSLTDKHIRADWELPQVSSCISIDAPVLSVIGHDGSNRITYAVSDTLNKLDLEAAIQEEDGNLYCQISLETNQLYDITEYSFLLRIDKNHNQRFSDAIQGMGKWLASQLDESIQEVPDHARLPVYSTWYSYHQNFTEEDLLEECRLSKNMGYEIIIVDDGWQTMDDNRGYDYTGDWGAERFQDMGSFVSQVHEIGMKIMLWYSVPFCGKKSQAYQKFQGKFLTEDHPWAPVFDPRFPEVRDYLISRYVYALQEWNIDGFKLDFIDDFTIYPETELIELNGRDVLSVNKGVGLLIIGIKKALTEIQPDILIEFRQKYISPALRILGNMFRAFDCPYDHVLNRIRTTDVKLLCDTSAVHSDMIAWHKTESVELAALQLTNVLFSVPQLSVRLGSCSEDHKRMIAFYTQYWLENREVLLSGHFIAHKPMANYPILQSSLGDKTIYGLYEDLVLTLDHPISNIDIINGKMSQEVYLKMEFQATP